MQDPRILHIFHKQHGPLRLNHMLYVLIVSHVQYNIPVFCIQELSGNLNKKIHEILFPTPATSCARSVCTVGSVCDPSSLDRTCVIKIG